MMNRKVLIFILAQIFFAGCKRSSNKEPILLADREAPLGWMYLRIYDDKSFEFESRGLERKGEIYSGHIVHSRDTIIFKYNSEIPEAGDKAIISKDFISYVNGDYPESMKITLNKLKKIK